MNYYTDTCAALESNERLILMGYRGSISHGTQLENSIDDIDLIGVYIAPPEFYYGWQGRDTIELFEGDYDIVLYELKKFLYLCSNFNPNAVSLIYSHETDIKWCTEAGKRLQALRSALMSKKAYYVFKGYAQSQLKQMEKHSFHGYESSKRQELVDKFGYDIKHASHLIRLLRMGCEVLEEGKMRIKRPDAGELKAIKQGQYSHQKITEMARELFQKLDFAYENTCLPEKPDYGAIQEVLNKLIHGHMENCLPMQRW